MKCNTSFLSIVILLFWSQCSRILSEIHSHSQTVTIGSTLKLQCLVNTNNVLLIKWYKDGEEFCRFYADKKDSLYFKHRTQELMTTENKKRNQFCDKRNLKLEVDNVTCSGIYTCHIVFEAAKKIKIIKRSTSVLVYPITGPYISGIKSSYKEGEIIQANCTTSPSNPPPSLVWYINGVAAYGWSMFSYPCQMTVDRLCVLRIGLRISATKKVFPKGIASFVCEAGILALPPRRAFVTSTLVGMNNTGNIHLFYGGLVGVVLWQLIPFF